jgi:hypothetical protein
VVVGGSGPLADKLRTAVDAQPLLRAIGPSDELHGDVVLAEVRTDTGLSLVDGGTVPLAVAPGDDAGVGRIVASLVRLARTASLRRLTPGPGEQLAAKFTTEFGRVVDGKREALAASGTLLHVGEPVYVWLRNDSTRPLYFFVFDLGVGGAATLLSSADPSGRQLAPGDEYVLGQRDGGKLVGTKLAWDPNVPTEDARPESVLVIVTSQPDDLAVLAHGGVGSATRGSSPIRSALAAAFVGGTRDWPVDSPSQNQYAVARFDWNLSAVPAPVAEEATFLVDERPGPAVRLLAPRDGDTAARPTKVAVRLNELVVHRNRALGSADVRVDTLVLTGGPQAPHFSARTARFSNVRDGDRLPLDNLLVYHGPAVDFLDLAWWVSRDRRDSLALSDMLRDQLNSDDLRHALEAISGLALAAPQAAILAAAISGCAVVVNTAYRLLSRAVGDSVGLYRTSLLASERFGVGRHPRAGVQQAQDFSFAYEILAVE